MTRLWALAKGLPVRDRDPITFPEWEGNSWGDESSLSEIADHMRRVLSCDLDYPVILSAEGELMDGCHRLIKAHLDGVSVKAVQFERTPLPDRA